MNSPNPLFVVDGLDDADTFAGDGHLPPFCIFCPEAQDYLPITFQTREEAQKMVNVLNSFIGNLTQEPAPLRTRAWRRVQRQKAVARALPVVRRFFGRVDMTKVLRWADNLRKCSCSMCNSGNPHDSRQSRRAKAAQQHEMKES
jgi:hypothetical protein